MKFRVSQKDINRNRLVEPNLWYEAEVMEVYEEQSKSGDSYNTKADLQIVGGEYEGVVITRVFSEKAPGFVIPYLEAFGIKVEPDTDYDLEATKGRRLGIFVKHREYQGKMYNDVDGYRPAQ